MMMNGYPADITPQIVEANNPLVFTLPEIVTLIERAFPTDWPAPAVDVIDELSKLIDNPQVGVLLGRQGTKFQALAICIAPGTKLFQGVQVYHFYNEGSPALRNALVNAVVEWSREKGFAKLLTYNANVGKDPAFERLFKSAGPATNLGSIYRFDLGEA